jgi:hypothetical protein
VYGFKKYPLKNQLTILLLVVFALIKANPCYYILQYSAASDITHSRQATSINNTYKTDHLLIKLDKSITESVDSKHVPEIKFAGIPFALFFLALPVVFCRRTNRMFSYLLSPTELCINTCILRL